MTRDMMILTLGIGTIALGLNAVTPATADLTFDIDLVDRMRGEGHDVAPPTRATGAAACHF